MMTNPETFPFIVVGNKLDIQDENRQVSTISLQRFCQENGDMPYIETSAKNNTNVEAAFSKLAERALAR
jgi:GTPase SAR1 family protein